MSEQIEVERDTRFIFDTSRWSAVIKYDEQTDYKKIKDAIEKTKGVDFIGILDNEILSLMEVKSFRGHRIETKYRLEGVEDSLDLETAQKFRDTIVGIIGAARNSTHLRENWTTYTRFLLNSKKKIHVVLWLEKDEDTKSPNLRIKRDNARGGNLTRRLRQKMNWLTSNVFVSDINDNPYSTSLKVAFLPENPA